MSTYGTALVEGGNLVANIDLSARQFCAAKMTTTARNLTLASTGGENISGLIQNQPTLGLPVELAHAGFAKALAGVGGFTTADQLQTEVATGKLITKAAGLAVAIACETCAAGEIGLVRLLVTAG